MLRKTVSVYLCLLLCLSLCLGMPASSFASLSASSYSGTEDTETTRGVCSAIHGIPEISVYSDSAFRGDSLDYNDSLATMSFVLCYTTQYTRNLGKRDLCFNMRQYLDDNGFTDFEASDDFYADPMDGTSSPVACAHKKIQDNGKVYTLLALVPKSGTRGSEHEANSIMSENRSDTGDYAGFARRAERIESFAGQYIKKYGISGDVKVWVTGYSGGGCTAQILAADLLRDPQEVLGDDVKLVPSDLYCYAFSGMRVAPLSGDYQDSKFDYIHNYFEDGDLTADMHTQNIFDRYGRVVAYSETGDKARMLEMLAMDSPSAFEKYTGKGDPDDFTPYKIDTSAILKGQFSVVPDPDSYLPKTQGEYVDSMLDPLSELYMRSGDGDPRSGYFIDYQKPMMAFSKAIDNDTYLFMQALTGTKTSVPMLISMYMTYMLDKSIRDKRINAAHEIEDAFNTLAGMIEDENGDLIREYSSMSIYKQLRDRIFNTVEQDGARRYVLKYSFTRSAENKLILRLMKRLTGRLCSMSFETTFEANGIDRSRYEEFLSTDNSSAIAWIFSSVLFANSYQTGAAEKFSFENEQFKQVATLLGNLDRLLIPHNSSNIIEWLRSADENYADYAAVDAAHAAGYRRLFIRQKDGVSVSGEVADAKGTVIAKFKDGKIVSSSDPWVCITSCDTGNWLRLPLGEDYKVSFNVSKDSSVDLKIADYSQAEAEAVRIVRNDNNFNWTGLAVKAADGYTLNIPAANCDEGQYDITSAYYSLSITKGEDPAGEDTGMPEVYSSSIPKVKGLKVTSASKSMTVEWKKLSADKRRKYSRTEIQYSTDKKFSKSNTVRKEVSRTRTSVKFKKLKKGTTYYVRVRNLKYRNEKKIVSKWSSVKKVTVK